MHQWPEVCGAFFCLLVSYRPLGTQINREA